MASFSENAFTAAFFVAPAVPSPAFYSSFCDSFYVVPSGLPYAFDGSSFSTSFYVAPHSLAYVLDPRFIARSLPRDYTATL